MKLLAVERAFVVALLASVVGVFTPWPWWQDVVPAVLISFALTTCAWIIGWPKRWTR